MVLIIHKKQISRHISLLILLSQAGILNGFPPGRNLGENATRISNVEHAPSANGNPHRIRRREAKQAGYFQSCSHMFDVFPNKVVRLVTPFHGKKQYPAGLDCHWELVGYPDCYPVVRCKEIDFRGGTECDSGDRFYITDGLNGGQEFCGTNRAFTTPLKPRTGYNLFIDLTTDDSTHFDRLYKGVNCEVHCHNSENIHGTLTPLEEGDPLKVENTLMCGRKFDTGNDRIVGGETAKQNEFPWQVAIVYPQTRQPFCGGSLINNRFVLTAAHCVFTANEDDVNVKMEAADLQVMFRAHFLDVFERDEDDLLDIIPGMQEVEDVNSRREFRAIVKKIIPHDFYDKFVEHDSDIALLELETPLDLKDKRTPTPICLPGISDIDENWKDLQATISGWGLGDEKGKGTAKVLQKVSMPVVDAETCIKNMAKDEVQITPEMLCAGHKEGKKDACQGDSGGPLVIEVKGRWIQIGVVSFGLGCAEEDTPGIFAHVARFLPWIRHKTMGSIWPSDNAGG